ncbi:MAG: SpoIIE family protein phosphatase [Clostridia bacterium]|nr:SpoIIE family protein phosphatase [Clostridia bacterium]
MKKKKRISLVITVWLVAIVLAACVVSAILTYVTLSNRSKSQTKTLVTQNVEDVSNDIAEIVDNYVLSYINDLINSGYNTADVDSLYLNNIAEYVEKLGYNTAEMDNAGILSAYFQYSYQSYPGIEINIVDAQGFIIVSSNPDPRYIGYDMRSGLQSAEFAVLLDGSTDEFVQDLKEKSLDGNQMKYAGKRFSDGSGFLQVGLTIDEYRASISSQGEYAVTNRRIGEVGYLIVCDENLNIINSYHNIHNGKSVIDAGIEIDKKQAYSYKSLTCDVFGIPSYVTINEESGIYIIGVYSASEAITSVNTMLSASLLLEIVVFSVLLVALFLLLRKLIVKNIVKVNNALAEITEGNLDEKIEVRDTYEFDALSTDINNTVDKLKGYIAEAAARIDTDLAIAKAIQTSVLPSVFPPFPDRKEFELFASMHAAKEVGGDFYDFFMLGDDTLGFLIADVSGKSIPGAMFMMTGRTIIKSLAESGLSPAEVFTVANKKLCEGNDAGLFITAWMGYLDLKTGLVRVTNAGHNPPVLIRDGKAEYVKLKSGFVLAGMDGMVYKEQTLQLQQGDILYLYTDGVTEAADASEKQYGEERLKNLLSFGNDYPAPAGNNGVAGAVCGLVTKDIDAFVQGAEQSDDITMLCVKFMGNMKEITVEATTENIIKVIGFVDEILQEYGCGTKEQVAIDIAIDELFSNIAYYAYNPKTGYATVRVNVVKDPLAVEITFVDNGVPYDPLSRQDPDTTLSAEDRKIGGLGIFMVKKSMDAVTYEYKDGKNILTIKKNL